MSTRKKTRQDISPPYRAVRDIDLTLAFKKPVIGLDWFAAELPGIRQQLLASMIGIDIADEFDDAHLSIRLENQHIHFTVHAGGERYQEASYGLFDPPLPFMRALKNITLDNPGLTTDERKTLEAKIGGTFFARLKEDGFTFENEAGAQSGLAALASIWVEAELLKNGHAASRFEKGSENGAANSFNEKAQLAAVPAASIEALGDFEPRMRLSEREIEKRVDSISASLAMAGARIDTALPSSRLHLTFFISNMGITVECLDQEDYCAQERDVRFSSIAAGNLQKFRISQDDDIRRDIAGDLQAAFRACGVTFDHGLLANDALQEIFTLWYREEILGRPPHDQTYLWPLRPH